MGEKMKIKGMIETVVSVPIVGAGLGMIGGAGMGALTAPTQVFTSLGLLGQSIKNSGLKLKK